MNPYQFYAERKKLPPVTSRIITGQYVSIITNEAGKVHHAIGMVPEDWWANMCRSKTS